MVLVTAYLSGQTADRVFTTGTMWSLERSSMDNALHFQIQLREENARSDSINKTKTMGSILSRCIYSFMYLFSFFRLKSSDSRRQRRVDVTD